MSNSHNCSGANTFNIEFVTIGNPGNAADTTGNPNPAGSVPYTYRMGTFEISEQMTTRPMHWVASASPKARGVPISRPRR